MERIVSYTQLNNLSFTYIDILVEPIDMDKLFKPSSELKKYIENARRKETNILEKRKRVIAQLNWL